MVSYSSTQLLIEYYAVDSDSFVGEIDISNYDLATINKLCPPEIEDDFEYCNGVFVEKESFLFLKDYIDELKDFNYEDYHYNILTRGIW